MIVEWRRCRRLEDCWEFYREEGWYVTVATDDHEELINWASDMLRGSWQVRTTHTFLGQLSAVMDFKIDDDEDLMIFKLTWK